VRRSTSNSNTVGRNKRMRRNRAADGSDGLTLLMLTWQAVSYTRRMAIGCDASDGHAPCRVMANLACGQEVVGRWTIRRPGSGRAGFRTDGQA